MGVEENKSSQEDQAWFDALSGKVHTGPVAKLRKMLREVEAADAAKEDTRPDWERLQFALRREANQRKKNPSTYRYYAMAASLLIVAGTVTLLLPSQKAEMDGSMQTSRMPTAEMMRGNAEQVVWTATPDKDAKQLEGELLMLGVLAKRCDFPDKTELNITMVYPLSAEVLAVFAAHVIPVPEDGDLNVVFMQQADAK